MNPLKAFNLNQWIEQHREFLKPPVCNRHVFQHSEFIIMVVGGPNARSDYHEDPGEEFFYQLEGDMMLRTMQDGGRVDIPIREGEILLLPARVPHSPQRFANTVGLVIERQRRPEEQDGFLWYCDHCQYPLYAEYLHVERHRKTTAADLRSLLRLAAEPHLPGVRHRRAQALSDERFVATSTPVLTVDIAGRRWRVGAQGRDISIPLEFDAPQPTFFGASPAAAAVVSAGSFVGDVRRGGSCNCSTYTLTPHCNGTHTECVGHVTAERLSVRDLSSEHFSAAAASFQSKPTTVITRAGASPTAVAPHELASLPRARRAHAPEHARQASAQLRPRPRLPYFDAEAMHWIVSNGITALVVDLPSLDRGDDAQPDRPSDFLGPAAGRRPRLHRRHGRTRRSRSWRSSTIPSPTGSIC